MRTFSIIRTYSKRKKKYSLKKWGRFLCPIFDIVDYRCPIYFIPGYIVPYEFDYLN